MGFIKKCAAIFIIIGCATTAISATPDLPAGMIYQGKPIEPICLDQFGDRSDAMHGVIDLKACKLSDDDSVDKAYLPIKGPDYGYGYRNKGSDAPNDSYISYRYVGATSANMMVLVVSWSSGGTGRFTDVVGVMREGDTLKVAKVYANGDRCNGGITDATVKDGSIFLTREVTPRDFISLPGADPYNLQHTDNLIDLDKVGLEGCPLCCIGEFKVRIGQHEKQDVLGFIPADEAPKDDGEEWQYLNPNQSCFNRIYNGVPKQKFWTKEQLKEFVQHFNRTCVEKRP